MQRHIDIGINKTETIAVMYTIIFLLFLTHLRLHDVNMDIIKNYTFLVTYYLKIHLMLALSHYVVI